MVTIDISYKGNLHCLAIHKPSGKEIETDAPIDNRGKGESFSPSDLLATSVGVGGMTIMGIVAMDEGFNIEGSKVRIEKYMSSDVPRRVVRLNVYFDMIGGIPQDKRTVLETSTKNNPVMKSIHTNINVNFSFNYMD